MGNWNITIIGIGSHHNKDDLGQSYKGDADMLFQKFVKDLEQVGQRIEHASFIYGGQELPKVGDVFFRYDGAYTNDQMVQRERDKHNQEIVEKLKG